MPTPTAGPATAATTGFSAEPSARRNWNTGGVSPTGGDFMKSSRSLPALNMPALPRIRIARTDASPCASTSASAIV
ncbi:hypothetical protein OKW35_001407 [Paraburkholderia sp. MM5477-R1]